MKIELRNDYTYAMLVPTSMGVRLTPAGGQPVHCSDNFLLHATSAESNVVSVSSYLGLPVKVLTTFVKGSPIARFIKDNLASRHIDYEGREVVQGGPWGYRHQIVLTAGMVHADRGYIMIVPARWGELLMRKISISIIFSESRGCRLCIYPDL